MKFLKNLFQRSKKSEKTPNITEAILNLRVHEDDLIKKQECLDKKIEQVSFFFCLIPLTLYCVVF